MPTQGRGHRSSQHPLSTHCTQRPRQAAAHRPLEGGCLHSANVHHLHNGEGLHCQERGSGPSTEPSTMHTSPLQGPGAAVTTRGQRSPSRLCRTLGRRGTAWAS